MITVDGVSKYYGDFKAVDDISFAIKDGEITGLLGPNGAGKTTTLRMLTNYFTPDGGAITIGDLSALNNPIEVKRSIGYLPESAPIYADMIVLDYLQYIAEIRGVEDENRIKEIAQVCGILEVMHKNVSELSKGYKQRVGLAHAMIHDPEILILDEPTSGLDPNQIIEIRNLIKEIGKKKTVILSTHILSEVEATCDRVIIINKGKIVADDRTENLRRTGGNENIVSISTQGADFNTLAEELKTIDGVIDVQEVMNDDFTAAQIITPSDNDLRPQIFRRIADKGWVLFEMMQEQQSLENIFRDLTTGGDIDEQ